MVEQTVVANHGLPTGENVIPSALPDRSSEDRPYMANGTLSLWHGETKAGEALIRRSRGSS